MGISQSVGQLKTHSSVSRIAFTCSMTQQTHVRGAIAGISIVEGGDTVGASRVATEAWIAIAHKVHARNKTRRDSMVSAERSDGQHRNFLEQLGGGAKHGEKNALMKERILHISPLSLSLFRSLSVGRPRGKSLCLSLLVQDAARFTCRAKFGLRCSLLCGMISKIM